MALNVTFTPGNVMVAGVKWSVDDWNAALRGSVTITGSVGASDLADDAITFAKLNPNFILGGTTADDLASGDMIPFGQVDSADNRVITFQYFLRSIVRECTEVLTFADYNEDRVVFWRGADDLPVAMGVGRFFEQQIEQAPEVTSTNQDWEVLVRRSTETDGGQAARTMLRHLLPDIVTAKTVNNPTQVVIDSKGRVISMSDDTTIAKKSQLMDLPTLPGYANATSMAHSFGVRPDSVTCRLVCQVADAGWEPDDEVDFTAALWDSGTGYDLNFAYQLVVETTAVKVVQTIGNLGGWIGHKTTGDETAFTPANWKAYVVAWK